MDILDVVFTASDRPSLTETVPIPTTSATESFEAYTPNSTGSRKKPKSFEHYKIAHVASGPLKLPCELTLFRDNKYSDFVGYIPGNEYVVAPWDAYGDPGRPVAGLPLWFDETRSDGYIIPPPSQLDDLKAMSARTMLPVIKAELSLPNSLYELRDFKSLPRTVEHLEGALRKVSDFFGAKFALRREKYATMGKLLGSTSRAGSDVYLQTQFNLKPLVSDICGIHATLTTWEKRINALLTGAGRNHVKHFSYTWSEHADVSEEKTDTQYFAVSPASYNTYHYYHPKRYVWYEPTTFHAQIRYNYVCSDYQRQHAALLGILDQLGFNLNPAIIWNAIPWSFVVDWVFGVSRWLDQFKLTLMEPTINIQSYLWSIKRRRRIMLTRFYPVQHSQTAPGPEVALPIVHETAYRRQVDNLGINSILSSGLSLKEVSLGAALLVSRRRYRNNRNR